MKLYRLQACCSLLINFLNDGSSPYDGNRRCIMPLIDRDVANSICHHIGLSIGKVCTETVIIRSRQFVLRLCRFWRFIIPVCGANSSGSFLAYEFNLRCLGVSLCAGTLHALFLGRMTRRGFCSCPIDRRGSTALQMTSFVNFHRRRFAIRQIQQMMHDIVGCASGMMPAL